jgi:hypothetical protein
MKHEKCRRNLTPESAIGEQDFAAMVFDDCLDFGGELHHH